MPTAEALLAGVALLSLVVYGLSAGADYGGGVWDLLARGPLAKAKRELIARAIGPIWEANHVWLILVVVILFSGFPAAFALMTTALHIPLTLVLVGVVLRGSAFTFRSYDDAPQSRVRQRRYGQVFAVASLMTPLGLGISLGALAAGGIRAQDGVMISGFVAPWLGLFPFSVGLLALGLFAYLAAVYLTVEAEERSAPLLAEAFRRRALQSAAVAALLALVTLQLSSRGAPRLYDRLLHRGPLQAILCLALVCAAAAARWLWQRRYARARVAAALQVALIIGGFGVAQAPYLVAPDLDIYQAAAPPQTLRLLLWVLGLGTPLLLPSFFYLYRVFKGRDQQPRSRSGSRDRSRPLELLGAAEGKREPVVVIIGGGFGGLSAARELIGAPLRVILLDRTNHHLFQPLLYQVATSQLSPADIAKPIRSILSDQKNVTVSMSLVKQVLPETREVLTNGRRIRYDHLIVACGARHSYFGKDEWERHAPGIKSLNDAIEVRRRVLTAFEQAEKYEDEPRRRSAMTFVVVGAGPTGVETAGAIAELAHNTLKADFRNIDPGLTRVILVEAGARVLPTYVEQLSQSARRQLEALRVEVRLNTRVTDVGDRYVELDGARLAAHTVIWAAGNTASPLAAQLGAPVDRAGRALVAQDLTVPGHPEIQAIGDMVALKDRRGQPVPGVAPAAMQMGRHAAHNILRQLGGQAPAPFWYVDKGSLATIGRHAGIADMKGLRYSGWLAWLTWAVIHLFFLVGFRNRTLVFVQWVWAYVFYTRGARLISEIPLRAPTTKAETGDA